MSNLTTRNMLDAGASSATKNTEFTDAIYEDVSSDLTREHGPGGKKQPYSFGTTSTSGGVLDNVGGPAKSLGADAKAQSGASLAAGASSAAKTTDFTDGIHEDASKGIESVKGHGTTLQGGQSVIDTLKSKISGK